MADRNEKQVFISYSRFDYLDSNKQVIPGNAISKVMDAFNKAGITYWIDERGIYSGDEFVPLISKAIKACDVFLFISSAASNASDWTSNEIAAAYMYKKKIIPFRIDESTYNDSIIMFIAKLDYIDYNVNSDMAISRLVGSVLEYLKIQNFEKEKQEKEKENERKKKLQEQKKLISEIELSAAELDNDERDAELKRRRLINCVQNVEDEGERERLLNMIENSGSLYKKHKDEVQKLTGTIEQLTNERNCLKKDSYNTDKRDFLELFILHRVRMILGIYVTLSKEERVTMENDFKKLRNALRVNSYLGDKKIKIKFESIEIYIIYIGIKKRLKKRK